MKRLLFIAIIALVSTTAKAQNDDEVKPDPMPVIEGNYQYQEVVNVGDAFKKDQLYKNAKVYFMDIFSGAKDAFQYDDKEEGRIIGKGFLSVDDYKSVFPGVAVLKWDVYYNVEITCKDGKYRYRVYDVLITREGHVAENNYRNVHLTVKDVYDAMPKQKGAYKTLYPKVMNKMLADLKTNITTLKENMVKQGNLTASF